MYDYEEFDENYEEEEEEVTEIQLPINLESKSATSSSQVLTN